MTKLPSPDEIVATSMLLGDPPPMLCSLCMGKGTTRGIFGGNRRCVQCGGIGYSVLGRATREALELPEPEWIHGQFQFKR